jgi:hypothetical protein
MTERYKLPSDWLPIDRRGGADMERFARLDMASAGELIRALEARGYRVFPANRVMELVNGWFIDKTKYQSRGQKRCG